MQSAELRELTASEPLSLEEEFEMQSLSGPSGTIEPTNDTLSQKNGK